MILRIDDLPAKKDLAEELAAMPVREVLRMISAARITLKDCHADDVWAKQAGVAVAELQLRRRVQLHPVAPQR